MARSELTDLQRRFADCYRGDAAAAAREAGYKGTDASLRTIGSRNLKHPGIAARILERSKASASTSGAPVDFGGDVNLQAMAAVRDDPTQLGTARLKAADMLARYEREAARAAAPPDATMEGLRAALNEALRDMDESERERARRTRGPRRTHGTRIERVGTGTG